jgi:hypothetical protein
MARLFVTSINLNKNELQNARVQNLSSAPSSPVTGQIYYDTVLNTMYFWNGTAWVPTSGSAEVIQDTVDTMIIAGTGLDKTYDDNAGTLTLDIDSTVTTNSGTQTLSNKTLTAPKFADGGFIADANGNESIKITATGSAVNEITVVNAATGAAPAISASGGDTNVDLNLTGKGSGVVKAGGVEVVTTSGTQTLTNKTITSPTVSGLYVSDSSIVFEGSSNDGSETTIQVANPTDDRTITFPNANGTVILSTNKVTDLAAPTSDFSMNSNKITNLATPTNSSDAATKAYVDGVAEGLHVHEAARVYVSTNINLANALEAGDVIDGVTLIAGDRVLVNAQTTTSQNGIYVVQATGAAVRALDFDTAAEVDSGDFIFVTAGTTYAATGWVQTLKPATIGTDPISFTQFSGAGTYLAGAGLDLVGSTFSVDITPGSAQPSLKWEDDAIQVKLNTSDGLEVTASGVGINNGTGLVFSSGALTLDTASGYGIRKYAASVGNGALTSIALTHSLGTKDVTVHIYDNASPYAQVEADVEHTDTNNVTVKFAVAPTTNQYRVVIVG